MSLRRTARGTWKWVGKEQCVVSDVADSRRSDSEEPDCGWASGHSNTNSVAAIPVSFIAWALLIASIFVPSSVRVEGIDQHDNFPQPWFGPTVAKRSVVPAKGRSVRARVFEALSRSVQIVDILTTHKRGKFHLEEVITDFHKSHHGT